MGSPTPIFVRMFKVQETFGVSDDQVRIWSKQGRIDIIKRGRMSFVRTTDMAKIIEGKEIQPVG
ncbi:hypothetical protein [uncultured Pelagimonas sp.]|uniref:hypothetical protein n=1 Tax=uncultured Pelagimonas sp. TaxID=1618102 RepID=UPI002606D267|nr:hypothetical protein [uncultured Pelagimonas sp.]